MDGVEETDQKKISDSYAEEVDDSDDDSSHEGQFDNPDTVIDLDGRQLQTISDIFIPKHAKHFVEVHELNLQNNELKKIPSNLAQILPKLEIVNLNNNKIEDLYSVVDILSTFPNLKSLFINLALE